MNIALDYQQNITEFPYRKISAIHKPLDHEDLREILSKANQTQTPVYPISTGHNWGLGSKLPISAAEVIDLSGFNKIVEVNQSLRYARIEPGVTQKQLHEYLEANAPELMLNVTGSDANSSILGNSLERGSGKNGHRAEDIRELTVMLPNGEMITTGFGAMDSPEGSFYKYGMGPDLTHLFTQSNYGVATQAVINLMEKQPFHLYLAVLEKDRLGVFFEEMSRLVNRGILGHSLEIDSQNDPKIFELFDAHSDWVNSWFAWFVIYGPEEVLQAKESVLKSSLQNIVSEVRTYSSQETDKHEALPDPVKVRIKRYNGEPNDHSLIASAKNFGVTLTDDLNIDLYKEMPGFRCVLPVIPFSRNGANHISFIEEYSKAKGFDVALSIIAFNNFSMEVFARVYFDRNKEASISKAADWAKGLLDRLKERGIYPYRLDIENMIPYLTNLNSTYNELKEDIKTLFDPNGILAPGRYIL